MAAGDAMTFLHVVRPEIDCPHWTDEHSAVVYDKGRQNLKMFTKAPYTVRDDKPALYVYSLASPMHTQTGLFGLVSVDEYRSGKIKKHENTRPPKVKDRTRHIVTQRAHAEPVMFAYPDNPRVDHLVAEVQHQPPLYDFTASDGVRHTMWQVLDTAPLEMALSTVQSLYVADGHHRCQAASEAHSEVGEEGSAYFPAVLFPAGQMQILPYNRVVHSKPDPLQAISASISVGPEGTQSTPQHPGEVCVYANGGWHVIQLPETQRDTVADTLDVARLSEYVLEPAFGILDQRSDPNINFVGGSRGTKYLADSVDDLGEAVAFSMYATSMQELLGVSDADLLMPPKSTWFEPKLRSGLLVNLFDE